MEDTDTQDPLRSYQWEMLEASLRGNTIVVMPTGSGKTRVAIERIRRELERSDSSKLVWFLANSVELSQQHHRTLQTHLPACNILSLTGADGVDNWSDQRLWDAVLAGVQVVIGTPAVLKDALTHGFVRISRLGLLIFDEAHHCIKNHPMNAIMRNFYHPAKSRMEQVPHIIGLTASPAINPKEGSLNQLENNLDARVATPKRSLKELMQYVHPPHIDVVTYVPPGQSDYPGTSHLCRALAKAAAEYDFTTDPFVLGLRRHDDERARRALQKVSEKQKTRCSEQIRILNRCTASLYDQLGMSSAEAYVRNCIERFERSAVRNVILPDATMLEQQHLLSILQAALDLGARSDSHASGQGFTISAKMKRLVFLLYEQQGSPQEEGQDVKAIIFVKERGTVVGLTHLLRNTKKLADTYRIGGFVGTSSFDGRSSIADLAEPKQQAQDLKDFRDNVKNLIVATSVLEEGIDVQACNLVINFDAPDTLIAFLQRRGRARRKDSKYYALVPEGDVKFDPLRWQTAEAKMKQEYMDAQRERKEAESLDEGAISERVYRVPSTGAILTLIDAKAHLNHFCSLGTLHVSNYVDTRPDYFAEQLGAQKWTATVTLPSFVHPDVRTAKSNTEWRGETSAIMDAAFSVYVALHKAGLVNDNLLPLIEDYEPDDGGRQPNQPSIVPVAERQSAWLHAAEGAATSNVCWHEVVVTLTHNAGGASSTPLLIPRQLLQDETFTLYWNEKTTYLVTISVSRSSQQPISDIEAMRQNTLVLLRSVHGTRMPEDSSTDFVVLLASAQPLPSGSVPAATQLHHGLSTNGSCGLIQAACRGGRSYVFGRLQPASLDGQHTEPSLVVTAFPKRKDFLHPLTERRTISTAYTAEDVLPLAECMVDRLPLPYSIFSAFLPSIMHRIDVRLLAQELQHRPLRDVGIHDTSLVIEAITAPSAGGAIDYNRLEYLGDSILKFCASLEVTAQHLTWPERYLTLEKFRLVRNSTLCRSALALGVDKYILTKPFTGAKWKPICFSDLFATDQTTTRDISSKTLADVAEALIGAAYVDGGLGKAYQCIQTLLPNETWYLPAQTFDRLTSELAPCDQHQSLALLEELVGHHFTHPTLLVEAVTHASLPFQRTGMSYERLEFLGDAVLDLVIVPKLHAQPRKLRHYEMHNVHEALVNGVFLGFCCMSYSLPQAQNKVFKGEQGYSILTSAKQLHLHDFIRASGQLLRARETSLEAFEKYHDTIETALSEGKEYPWPDLLALSPQKFFSDLIESVLGALYIDTHGDLTVCEQFLEKLGVLAHMRMMLGSDMNTMSPKERLGVAAGSQTVEYLNSHEEIEGRRTHKCTVKVGEKVVAMAEGCGGKAEAEARAAEQAVKVLRDAGACRKRKAEESEEMDVEGAADEEVDGYEDGGDAMVE